MADTFGTLGQTNARWQGGPIREDVLNAIYQITPEDTPFFNMIGDSKAQNPYHEWNTRALTTRAHNAHLEGMDFSLGASFHDPVVPTRVGNVCQIIRKLPRVTESIAACNLVAIGDLMADQIELKSVEWKTDVEHTLLRGSLRCTTTAGDTSPRQMGGFRNVITSNLFNYGSTASLSETIFNNMMFEIWSDGGKAQDVLVNGYMKRRVSSFTDSATKFFQSTDRKVINTIGVYESDFHVTAIHLSRDVSSATGVYDLFFLSRDFFAKSWLRPPSVTRLPKLGDDFRARIIGEVTLEFGNEMAAGILANMQG